MTHFLQHVKSEASSANREVAPILWSFGIDTEPPPGTHLVTPRDGYNHHGIYLDGGKVMHYAGLCRPPHSRQVEEVTITRFAAGHAIWIKPSLFPKYVGDEVVRRACSRLGENRYRLLTNNCEHFCTWCVYGESCSEQVEESVAHPLLALPAVISMFKALLKERTKTMHSRICTV